MVLYGTRQVSTGTDVTMTGLRVSQSRDDGGGMRHTTPQSRHTDLSPGGAAPRPGPPSRQAGAVTVAQAGQRLAVLDCAMLWEQTDA